jgi:ligand-binding sensor domain-containing protein
MMVFYNLSNKGIAQIPLRFDHLGREEGLSQSSVNCMLRDHNGLMWFGTQDGLNMYDGNKFRIFQNKPGDSTSLSNNYIVSICEDEEGILWVGTMTGGLNRFDRKTETFRVFRTSGVNSISDNTVWSVLSDGKGKIWTGTSNGLNLLDKTTGKFSVFKSDSTKPESIINSMVISLYKDKQEKIWAGTTEGLCSLENEGKKISTFINPAGNSMSGANIIWSVSGTPSGKIVTGTNNGIFELDTVSKKFTLLSGNSASTPMVAWSLFPESESVIWAGTALGLYRLSKSEGSSVVYLHNASDPSTIADNNIWCLLPDPSGFLWAGTKNGVSKSRVTAARFHLINDDTIQSVGLSSPRVMAILEDSFGYLWVGTDGGGLNCISPGMSKVTVMNAANSGLKNDAVWALAEDNKGNIWIGNYMGGLHVYSRTTGKIKSFPSGTNDEYALSNNRVLALLPADDEKVWIGTRGGGLVKFDPVSGRFNNFTNIPGDSTSISGNTVLSLAFDNEKRLWAGVYEGGLNMMYPGKEKFISFRKNAEDNFSLSDDNVWALLTDKEGRLWVGTQGGLNYAENSGPDMKFSSFGTRDGLKSNVIFGLAEDETGNIWMSHFNGLTRLDIKTFNLKKEYEPHKELPFSDRPLFRNFDTGHGLQGLEFNQGAYHRGRSGRLYFGGASGLNYFSADEIKESSFVSPVIITSLKIFNKEVSVLPEKEVKSSSRVRIIREKNNYFLPLGISWISELVLTYHESALSFEFASLDYTNPGKNQYAYKLSEFDKDWNYVGSQNTATYTNLYPGKYVFMVRGSNSDGIWNPEITELKITIVPPFWKTGWFLILLLILTFLLIRGFFVEQKRKARKERELMELQLKTIKSQIDPHFAFNALNTVASFIYAGEPDVTYDYFTRFALMIRNILNDNEKISRPLRDELEFVRNYLELQKIRFKDKFEYIVNVDDSISPDTQVPKMIIQTYAENAIKHGLMHRPKGGLLKIDVIKDGLCIRISVEDNGIGRAKASELSTNSTHKGLKIIEQIIELYRKLYYTDIVQEIEDLTDENGNSTGTKVVLTLSLIRLSRKKRIFSFSGNKINRYGNRISNS